MISRKLSKSHIKYYIFSTIIKVLISIEIESIRFSIYNKE